jgi:hypothetical protein
LGLGGGEFGLEILDAGFALLSLPLKLICFDLCVGEQAILLREVHLGIGCLITNFFGMRLGFFQLFFQVSHGEFCFLGLPLHPSDRGLRFGNIHL